MASSLIWRIVLVSLLASGHAAASQCPEGCKCIEMRTMCVDRNFTSVPTKLPLDTRDLYMKVGDILFSPCPCPCPSPFPVTVPLPLPLPVPVRFPVPLPLPSPCPISLSLISVITNQKPAGASIL